MEVLEMFQRQLLASTVRLLGAEISLTLAFDQSRDVY